ncbi:MAG: class I SAM-dependent methyltransferase [Acidobacteria bacterium]|nr:class I SAM-dependent methyltransferase [Acidobacteriota bacterium]
MNSFLTDYAKTIFLKNLDSLRGGSLELIFNGRTAKFGEPGGSLQAIVVVHRDRFFQRALFGGDVALGEAWMDGDWSSPDLVSVIRLAVRNLASQEGEHRLLSAFSRGWDALRHRLRGNSVSGSRRNIQAHYDLSNDFFRLFLDASMMYSCAFFEKEADSLEAAQFQKLDRICKKLCLGPEHHVLEIGTGWGGFAEHAVRNYGCRVTTTTISSRQYEHAQRRFHSIAGRDRIQLLQEDYRNLRGQYDKIVSIEMFEAVGLPYYDEFFRACDRLLRPDGCMLMQTITINEQVFPAYRRRADFIQKHIFPGSELASVSEILRSLARVTALSLYHAEDIGTHYARTLAEWRKRFQNSLDGVRALGFDNRFIRMWDYYLAYCEGAFLERHIGDFQLLLTKNHSPRNMFGEPWGQEGCGIDRFSHLAAPAVDTQASR